MSAQMSSGEPPAGLPGGVPVPPGPQGGWRAPRVLASDAERDQAVAILGGQYAEGRLTFEEYQERMAAAYAARTWGDLAEQVADLPVRLPFQDPAPAAVPAPEPAGQQAWDGEDVVVAILLCLVFPPVGILYLLLRYRRSRPESGIP